MREWVFQRRARWAQIFTDGRMPLECGTGQRLILTNVTYEQQGQYICLASNKINGNIREVKSDPVSLQVVGAPRVRRTKPNFYVFPRLHFSVKRVTMHRHFDLRFHETCISFGLSPTFFSIYCAMHDLKHGL